MSSVLPGPHRAGGGGGHGRVRAERYHLHSQQERISYVHSEVSQPLFAQVAEIAEICFKIAEICLIR